MPSLDAVAIFSEVIRAGSFTEAARKMRMPLSSVSRKVSDLEEALQVRLIDRSKRQIRLTEIGVEYYDNCRKGIDALAFANQSIREKQTDTAGTLRITIPPNLFEIYFLETIEIFRQRYPQTHVRVLVSERLLDFVDDGVDLSFRLSRPSQQSLIARKLLGDRHRLVASRVYVTSKTLPDSIEHLADHQRIGFGFQRTRTVSWALSRATETRELVFEPDLSINDYGAVKSAILNGLGIGELPGILCRNELRAGHLVEVLPSWRFPKVDLYAVHTGTIGLSHLGRLFLDLLIGTLKSRSGSPVFAKA